MSAAAAIAGDVMETMTQKPKKWQHKSIDFIIVFIVAAAVSCKRRATNKPQLSKMCDQEAIGRSVVWQLDRLVVRLVVTVDELTAQTE